MTTATRQTSSDFLCPLFLAATLTGCGGGGGMSATTGGGMPPTVDPTPAGGFSWSAKQEGVSGESLAGFLSYHQRMDSPYRGDVLDRWGSTPPVVRVASGATSRQIGQVRRAVEIINSALPRDWQMTFDPTPRQEDQPFGRGTVWYDGEIVVNYAPSGPGGPGGFSRASYGREEAYGDADIVIASRVSIATDNGGASWHQLALVIHEIGHTLGIGGDTWGDIENLWPRSIMTYQAGQGLRPKDRRNFLWPLDRDSFLALYTVLRPGMTPAEITAALSGWTATAYRIEDGFTLDSGETLGFGAWSRGVWAEPWADFPMSAGALADNAALSGTVTWSGRLAGMEPDGDAVRGDAALVVDLTTLDGDATFSSLQTWAAGVNPSSGAGSQWGSGRLDYDVTIAGATFRDSTGAVSGGFAGQGHEGMAGTLTRSDLQAGFGGVRSQP